ncbi:hypothetical protein [Deinococcus hopiensis]|uniref:Uncharacterized protein n=1 Tax=Deinococcus hopiensis KR-140 TaxID=695939 RepID=A0A1W1V838_9DEIO|nr:hypothetical protein [Deinococcus hopiensis]SMB89201.1 hypothetical protein SAMN00790413_00306 [Deinococcus hopiensis KR-140]
MTTKKDTEQSTTEAAPKKVASTPEPMEFESTPEGDGVRVSTVYQGVRANAYGKTEEEAQAALRKALIPETEK